MSVAGGTAAQQQQVRDAVDRILSTPRGKQLDDQIRGPWYWRGSPKTINLNCNQRDQSELGGANIFLDPNYHPEIETSAGWQQASLQRVIAHELGHTLGTDDDGPGRMNNVNLNENPIATQLGEPYVRIRY